MRKHVLLINPWIYDFSAYDYWMKPLGLLYMASYLRKNGIHVQFIDCLNPLAGGGIDDTMLKVPKRKTGGHGKFPKEALSKPAILQNISKTYHRYGMSPARFEEMLGHGPKPDCILVTSMMTYWYPGVLAVIETAKSRFPDVPIVLGGTYASLCPEHAKNAGADYLLTGDGESHIPFIVQKLLDAPLAFQPGLNDLDALPYPAFDLLIQPDQLPLLTSRGCPFRCPYCASHLLHPRFTRRDPLKVVNEIAHWNQGLAIQDFSFYDDALLRDSEKMAIPMMREIINRGLSCRFHCPNGLHLREVTSELAILMFKSGFRTLRFGFETSDLKRQREMGGKVDNSHMETAVAYLREAGYASHDMGIYVLCGLPGQDAAEISETIRYVQLQGAMPILAEFSPIPGTALWPAAVDASPFPIADEPLFHNNSLLPCQGESFTPSQYQDLKRMTRRPAS